MSKIKQVTGEELLEAITEWQASLADMPKVSATKFSHMQMGIYGCKMIIRKAFGLKQERENVMVK